MPSQKFPTKRGDQDLSRSRLEKGGRFVNDPVVRLGVRLEVSDVLRNAIVADSFEVPTAPVLILAKRRLRWEMISGHV
jgi:hypothetical protein